MNTDRFKFRGMTISGEWVTGHLTIITDNMKKASVVPGYYISNVGGAPFAYAVRPETVGQCTGIRDENGELIFEGDKIEMIEFYYDGTGEGINCFVGYVLWNNGEFIISQNPKEPEYKDDEIDVFPHLSWGLSFRIIGNMHKIGGNHD